MTARTGNRGSRRPLKTAAGYRERSKTAAKEKPETLKKKTSKRRLPVVWPGHLREKGMRRHLCRLVIGLRRLIRSLPFTKKRREEKAEGGESSKTTNIGRTREEREKGATLRLN